MNQIDLVFLTVNFGWVKKEDAIPLPHHYTFASLELWIQVEMVCLNFDDENKLK